MLAMVLAAAVPAFAQDSVNAAGVDSSQVLQQVGGDQYANAAGTGDGDTAAANNQEFNATQEQQSAAIAGDNNAVAQNIGGDSDEEHADEGGDNGGDEHADHESGNGEESEGDTTNVAAVNCDQILQQVGGDQVATATGSGEGDVAAANNQEFTADQIQQCIAIAGNNNAVTGNVGDVTDGGGDSGDEHADDSGNNGGDEHAVEGDENGGEHVAEAGDDTGAEAGDDTGAEAVAGDANGVDDDGDGEVDENGEVVVVISGGADSGDSGISVLPDTGGYSLIALGAGALLVAGGLIARRFVR
jgi:LPXTG-motif cell wall-anchored protein